MVSRKRSKLPCFVQDNRFYRASSQVKHTPYICPVKRAVPERMYGAFVRTNWYEQPKHLRRKQLANQVCLQHVSGGRAVWPERTTENQSLKV